MNKEIIEKIENILKERNISIKELSKMSELSEHTLENFFQLKSAWRINTLIKICDALKLSLDYVAGRERHKKRRLKSRFFYSSETR